MLFRLLSLFLLLGFVSQATASHPLNFLAIATQEEEEGDPLDEEDEEDDMIIIPDVSN